MLGTSAHQGTPSEEVGYQAHEEYTSRVTSPRAISRAAKSGLRQELSSGVPEQQENQKPDDEDTIHVDEPERTHDDASVEEEDEAPILANDEVAKHPAPADLHAAVEPSHDAHVETDEPTSRASSRHSGRPASARKKSSAPEIETTPLEDVEEYEPLFDEDGNEVAPLASPLGDRPSVPPRFPSKDIWEDAPSSVHQTTEVSTPDAGEARPRRAGLPERDVATPAQAFAKHQEELAEKEAKRMTNFVPRGGEKGSTWLPLQPAVVLPEARQPSPSAQRRFPSRDVWEDAPESHLHKTTVSSRQTPVSPEEPPEVPLRPVRSSEKPAIPSRPRPKKTLSDEVREKPVISDKPKPQIPVRPVRNSTVSPEAKEAPPVKPKPAVPSRPAGSKIAALQAGFMSDLNKRLQLGPMAPKKEEVDPAAAEEEKVEEKPKKPLSDARKGRARGPARRAPARSPQPPAAAAEPAKLAASNLSISVPQVIWSVDPEDGDVLVKGADLGEEKLGQSKLEAVDTSSESKSLPEAAPADASPVESRKSSEADGETVPANVEEEPPKAESPDPVALAPASPVESREIPETKPAKIESPEEPSPLETPPPCEMSSKETLPKEDAVRPDAVEESSPVNDTPPPEETPVHVIPAKADLAAVEPLDEDTTEGERVGELQAHAHGRSAEMDMDSIETSLAKET